ncbi:MAG: bifunctional hydroxymethylpyrimidine kinase/phosphomethylpyrimidine kinase [Nitrosopumilus sp. B06]|nr:MAG: bifunctional hydroxymethylpyrimidine kinase/phosphomethylpyrimidine kinase [Nitrosopumilus sp. B06]
MNLLAIGGSDPSSGAGIQGDIRVLSSLGAHCLSAITAVTIQNTSTFEHAEPVSPRIVGAQIRCVISDFELAGIKIGMVYEKGIIKAIHHILEKTRIPIVVDPVIESTTGGRLLAKSAVDAYKKLIIPLATAITPNQKEAEILAGMGGPPGRTARIIQEMGAKNVIITGIKRGRNISDYILKGDTHRTVSGAWIRGANRGSGGVHSAAVLFGLASGYGMQETAKFARQVSHDSIRDAKKYGRGLPITDAAPENRLLGAINRIINTKGMAKLIPQCQTNFVHSGPGPKNTGDVLGVAGRIVRTGDHVTMAGTIRYGGSKHVASALIAASSKFPQIRAAANIRYSEEIIGAARAAGMKISSYDRSREPQSVQSVPWGIKKALARTKRPPDVIYHAGGWGKEPMIIIFGNTPDSVAEKITTLIET